MAGDKDNLFTLWNSSEGSKDWKELIDIWMPEP
jgi:hypothetical protein